MTSAPFMNDPTACPVAVMGMELTRLTHALNHADEANAAARNASKAGPVGRGTAASAALESARRMDVLLRRSLAVKDFASHARPTSFEGAMVLLGVASTAVDDVYTEDGDVASKEALTKAQRCLHAVMALLESASSTPREKYAGEFLISRSHDPFVVLHEALAAAK
jgi:hypothetical protein